MAEKRLFLVGLWLLVGSVLLRDADGRPAPTIVDEDAKKFLLDFGYLEPPTGAVHQPGSPVITKGNAESVAAYENAIREFQRFSNLPLTGKMDPVTKQALIAPRCGVKDVVYDENGPQPFKTGSKWLRKTLTWKLENYTPDLGQTTTRRMIIASFKRWADQTNLVFNEVCANCDSDFVINFANREHGDGYDFDGEGRVLAHAFFPDDGRVHFDEDEKWTETDPSGSHLEQVATHEIGHSLGLSHSNVVGSIMAPYYKGFDPKFKLHADDVSGIQFLYGAKTAADTTPAPGAARTVATTKRTTPRAATTRPVNLPPLDPRVPDTCSVAPDDVFRGADQALYVIARNYVWKLNANADGVEGGFPKSIEEVLHNAPKDITAAVRSHLSGKTYLFRDKTVWRFTGFLLDSGYPKTITSDKFPATIDATLFRAGKIHLFSGANYYIWDEVTGAIKSGPQLIQKSFQGAPRQVTAAFTWQGGVYFVSGDDYYYYSEFLKRVWARGYPKKFRNAWMGCNPIVPK